jgi:glycosyltransferase involved in cell wall biosynthesis/ubiquinone/menaquinone biosynthesis C-methylase UbiE
MTHEVLELPFDQYQRYKLIQEIVNELREKPELSILDVGGWPGTLRRFLPDDNITIVDYSSWEDNYIKADGGHLPFISHHFDVVVTSDTLEHIVPDNRPTFLGELVRVSKGPVIVSAPFDSEDIVKAEEILQRLITVRYGEGYNFIEEHRAYGLPRLDETSQLLENNNLTTLVLPSGYLYRWLIGIVTFFLLQWRFNDPELSGKANAFYNLSFYHQDNKEPSYRKVVVAAPAKYQDKLATLADTLGIPSTPASEQENLSNLETLNILYQTLTERWSELSDELRLQIQQQGIFIRQQEVQLHEQAMHLQQHINRTEQQEATIQQQEATIQQQEATIQQQEATIQQQEATIQQLESKLNSIYQTNFWRLANRYWSTKQLLTSGLIKSPIQAARYFVGGSFTQAGREVISRGRRLKQKIHRKFHPILAESNLPLQTSIVTTSYHQHGSYDIICFANIDWEARYQRAQQTMTQFAKHGHRIFYIVASKFVPPNDKRGFKAIVMAPNVFEVSLRGTPPLNFYYEAINPSIEELFLSSLEQLKQEFQITSAVSVVHLSFWTPLVLQLREKWHWPVVYDCMDEWIDFPNIGQSLLKQEEILVRESEGVIVTAALLQQKWSSQSKKCLLIRNGVDFEFFTHNCYPNDLLKDIKHPIIGYYGALAEWIDFELINFLATQRPEWNFVLIGDIFVDDVAGIDDLSNVHLLGRRPYSEMPLYLYHFDVCLIPFKLNDVTHAVDPVKFYEYISVGKPVVTVPLSELLIYEQHAYLVDTPAGFLEKIELALLEKDTHIMQQRITLAKENNWLDRYKRMNDLIMQIHPKVSIILVTKSNLDHLKIAVGSILSNLAYPNYEIIIVDNGSEDGTRNYLQFLTRSYEKVRIVLENETQNPSIASNHGLSEAIGDFMILIDDKFILSEGRETELLSQLHESEVGMVIDRLHPSNSKYVAIRGNIFQRVGYLKDSYVALNLAFDDYAQRVCDEGYKILSSKNS